VEDDDVGQQDAEHGERDCPGQQGAAGHAPIALDERAIVLQVGEGRGQGRSDRQGQQAEEHRIVEWVGDDRESEEKW
jgi:hypothetical protein